MNTDNKNTELDNTDKKLHISDVRQRFIGAIERRLSKLKLDKESYSNSFKGFIKPTYSPTSHTYYGSLNMRIDELELMLNEIKNVV